MDRIAKIKEMLASGGEDAFLEHALALEYIKIGNDEEATLLFNTLLNRQPDYIGSYYHLGKLLERKGDFKGALIIYENGMKEARKQNDNHTYNELQAAYEDAEDN